MKNGPVAKEQTSVAAQEKARWLTAKEAAGDPRIRVSAATIIRLVCRGKVEGLVIPCGKRRRYRVRPESLEAWIESLKVEVDR